MAVTTILQGGRHKAYRPLPLEDRRAALVAGIAAYTAGDHFLAHELLEPAWMGTDDPAERELHQGVIKLAAAFVHAVRGNPLGIAKNLAGARLHLAAAADPPERLAQCLDRLGLDLDVDALIAQIDDRIAELAERPDSVAIEPIPLARRDPS